VSRTESVRRLLLPATALAALLLASASAGAPGRDRGDTERPDRGAHARPFFDVRAGAAAAPARPTPGQEELRRFLGVQGVVDVDPLTSTPRVVARLDGFLTEPSPRDAQDIALDYVRAHPGVFKLDEDDLAGLRLARDYTDVAGVRHLVWAQTANGIPAFDNDLRASVTRDGRLVNVLGSPLPDLADSVAAFVPSVDAPGGLRAALRNVGRTAREPRVVARGRGAQQATRFAGGHRADLVLFNGTDGVELAWHVTADADADEVYTSLVDASSGEVLRRANKVEDVGMAKVWDYFPGAAIGGTQQDVDLTPWLAFGASRLEGPFARVFADINDNDAAGVLNEEVASEGGDWSFTFDPLQYQHPEGNCAPARPSVCSWDSFSSASWLLNRKQNGTQVFYFVNTFHDHLEALPIGFNDDAGNFESGDRVIAHANDGANTGLDDVFLGIGMPDENHVNNANMLTRPDGQSPRMQMYLFTTFFPGDFATDPTPDVNGGDDASVVYHEYAHGLSNRLITYSNGWGALDAHQSGAMGEAWSDWYALDFLVGEGFAPDDPATPGEVTLDRYVGNGEHTLRSEGIDCPVGSTAMEGCPGAGAADEGGYTYGDLGKIGGSPQVHADGEIWGQTLWDLRAALVADDAVNGVGNARTLVTRAMDLSPPNPSFLDMRNAILQADTTYQAGANSDLIWQIFANRGMGFFAGTVDASDTAPVENFDPPPPAGIVGTLKGVVRDPHNGNKPVAGALVEIAGPDGLSDATDSLGRYSIAAVPVGDYPLLKVTKKNYDGGIVTAVSVAQDPTTTTRNLQIRRDWSARSGGARVTGFTGPDLSFIGCGPSAAIDQSLATGWASITGAPRSVTVRLPSYVDVGALGVDPGATCGDPADAATRGYKIEVSQTGKGGSYTRVKSASFGLAAGGRLNLVPLSPVRKAVRFVRFTMLSSHGNLDGFLDMSELSVYGKLRPSCFGQSATKLGTEGRNRIRGTGRADVIVGLGGNDVIKGRGGADRICGGEGNDTLVGGSGVDRFDGGPGDDTVNARDGVRERTIRGGPGRDRIRKDANDRASGFERRF
jgi:extracellular elastinolytic metalloproteinase